LSSNISPFEGKQKERGRETMRTRGFELGGVEELEGYPFWWW